MRETKGVKLVKVDAERSCWSADYVLAHCEHYRVESAEGTLGYVDELIWTMDGGELLGLLVRSDRAGGTRFEVLLEDVLELHPGGERIVVRRRTVESEEQTPPRVSARRTKPPALTA